jgi:hypothetical protein
LHGGASALGVDRSMSDDVYGRGFRTARRDQSLQENERIVQRWKVIGRRGKD